eukprot:2340636-Pleurochrysis_carterae.AAC.1
MLPRAKELRSYVGAGVGSGLQWMNHRLGPRPLHGRVRNKGGCERRIRCTRLYTTTTTKTILHDAR